MLSLKRADVTKDPVPDYERELAILYARRSAIDALIESLEEYDRFRETRLSAAEARLA